MSDSPVRITALSPSDLPLARSLLDVFIMAFDEADGYTRPKPGEAWMRRLLARDEIIVLVAISDAGVVGGLVAYELFKLERESSEIYLYDLAVAETHRREGIATSLITELTYLAHERGAWVVYVQADAGDEAPTALYTALGTREDVLHFDILPRPRSAPSTNA